LPLINVADRVEKRQDSYYKKKMALRQITQDEPGLKPGATRAKARVKARVKADPSP